MSNEFLTKIQEAKTIAIVGHIRPDGDCVGSCLGLYNYLIDNYGDKQVVVYLQPIADKFAFLNGADVIRCTNDNRIYDLCISLDCGDTDRHGESKHLYTGLDWLLRDSEHKDNNAGMGWMAAPSIPMLHLETVEEAEKEGKEPDSIGDSRVAGMGGK